MDDIDDQVWQDLESALRAHRDWKLGVTSGGYEIRTRAGKVLCPAGPLSQLGEWLATMTADPHGDPPRVAGR